MVGGRCGGWWVVAAVVGCGPSSSAGSGSESGSDSGGTTNICVTGGCDGWETSASVGETTDATSGSSGGTVATGSTSSESSTTGDGLPSCACGPDEVCVQWDTSHVCIDGSEYQLDCVPRPPTCPADDAALCDSMFCVVDLCAAATCAIESCGHSDAPVACSGQSAVCNPYASACSKGEICAPIDGDEDGVFETATCVAAAGDVPEGEACHLESFASGVDDCAAGLWCADAEPTADGLVGVCRSLCGGTPERPTCPQGLTCDVAEPGFLAVCRPA